MFPVGSSPLARGTLRVVARREPEARFIPARAGNTAGPPCRGRTRPVHPRSRGEHSRDAEAAIRRHGSSPLARGTRPHHPAPRRRRRFIPARAGNTPSAASTRRRRPVHPRSRGEHGRQVDEVAVRYGSSPLARGTRPERCTRPRCRRFIPARAGNTSGAAAGRGSSPVHPRSRGEHGLPGSCWWCCMGSSPLARGTPRAREVVLLARRFIPARAGNTSLGASRAGSSSVHPRSRGEHPIRSRPACSHSGSSPLARGTLLPPAFFRVRTRFIPARAGNTGHRISRPCPLPVHPRSRGEHLFPPFSKTPEIGSSPLARGTPVRSHGGRLGQRFIPARAGNTSISTEITVRSSVHPRSRGEHVNPDRDHAHPIGSSPLARGTRQRAGRLLMPGRFIPARAGNTARNP